MITATNRLDTATTTCSTTADAGDASDEIADEILDRYLGLFLLSTLRVHHQRWYNSKRDKDGFSVVKCRDVRKLARDHLSRNSYWIASPALLDGGIPVTDFVIFDFDVPDPSD